MTTNNQCLLLCHNDAGKSASKYAPPVPIRGIDYLTKEKILDYMCHIKFEQYNGGKMGAKKELHIFLFKVGRLH